MVKIPLQIIELEDDNFHLVVCSYFNDGTKVYWAVDTGASKTVFDKNLKKFYTSSKEKSEQLHTAGISEKPMETTIAFLNPLSIENLKLNNMRVALLDMSHINDLYSKVAKIKICGLLGGDFLMKYGAKIDYRNKIMLLHKKKSRFK